MGATESQAINSIGVKLDTEFDNLTEFMNDIASGSTGKDYTIGGIFIKNGSKTGEPQTMLVVSSATTNQQLEVGQLAEMGMKASQLKKLASQKLG